jgi:hypothetical protein
MPTTCPRCRSMLDISESLCRRCGWNAPYLVRRQSPRRAEGSFAERYRGTAFESQPVIAVARHEGVTRGRTFVVVSFASLAALAGAVLVARPPA